MPRNATESEAVTGATRARWLPCPSASLARPPSCTAAGYALSVDPMSATVLGYRALKQGYEAIHRGEGIGMDRAEVMEVIHEVGETMNIQALYDIEARTTEREHYREER
ncbi:MAG: hypothetical protein U5Q44_01835 [Dehalococcoidia bacterium]|nr:hypothetical protein [Dehalococcoidia bacterium]